LGEVKTSELSIIRQELVARAIAAREHSYAPYSKYKVGAAALDSQGRIHSGGNVENVAWATICAERSAIVKMVSNGSLECTEIAIVATSDLPQFPCGVCRQFLLEFGADMLVIAVAGAGEYVHTVRLSELLPHSFSPQNWMG
jgi:cytidine deaminase